VSTLLQSAAGLDRPTSGHVYLGDEELGERRGERATIRLLGGTTGHAIRMIVLEMVPTVLVALGAGAAVVAVSVRRRRPRAASPCARRRPKHCANLKGLAL
jgi:hypothetical protein